MAFATKPDRFSSCAIIPGRVSDPDGFVTYHRELDGMNGPLKIYFSIAGLRQLAQSHEQVGLVLSERLEDAEARIAELEAALDQATAQVADFEAQYERIAGFAKDGFKVQKVMGRPKEAKS